MLNLQVPKRLMLALSLLKKEFELSKLQASIAKVGCWVIMAVLFLVVGDTETRERAIYACSAFQFIKKNQCL